jgi:hypothetical protein
MDPISLLANLIAATFRVATPILLAATGETYAERSGVLNLGIEGTMFFGAFIGFYTADQTGSLWLGMLAAVIGGMLAGLLMGLLTVTLGVNQHVSGLSITLLLTGLSLFAFRLLYGNLSVPPNVSVYPPVTIFKDIPFLGVISEQTILTYLTFLVVIPAAWFLLYRTNYGLKIRSIGENPDGSRRSHAFPGDCRQFHGPDYQRPGLGGAGDRHLRQLEPGQSDVGCVDLRRHVCLTIDVTGPGSQTAHPLRNLPGLTLYRHYHRISDCRTQRLLPGRAAQTV